MSLQDSRQISDVKVLLKMGSDGAGISSIEKTGTSGLVDTYTITLSTGAKTTFTVTNGRGIVSIAKTSSSGMVDTYTITYNDGTTSTFDVTNGTGGVPIRIIITTDAGSTVSVTSPSGASLEVTQITGSTTQWGCNSYEYGTHSISVSNSGQTKTDTVNADDCKIYNVSIPFFTASITVNYPDDQKGETFTIINGGTTITETAPSDANSFTVSIPNAGTWTVTGAYSKDVVISSSGGAESVTFVALKTFSTATDAEIAGMVSEADAGNIDLYDDCGWRVGQEHSVELSSISSSGTYDGVSWSVGESQSAQTVVFVLMQKGLYELVTPVLDKQKQTRNTCSFIVGMKNCLSATGYMNSTATYVGSWNGCARRAWCNGGFREAIPSALRDAFKQFKTLTAETYNGTTNQISNDYFALVAEKEKLQSDATPASNTTEFNALTRFEWYDNASNRIKSINSSPTSWWGRSPRNNNPANVVETDYSGLQGARGANETIGLSPFGCM